MKSFLETNKTALEKSKLKCKTSMTDKHPDGHQTKCNQFFKNSNPIKNVMA